MSKKMSLTRANFDPKLVFRCPGILSGTGIMPYPFSRNLDKH